MKNSDSLCHYASKYYDPVKAHEYYMRTRELKGRRSSSKLSDEGKEAWAYTKEQITTSKKADAEALKAEKEKKIAALRADSEKTKERIMERLADLKKAIDAKRKNKLDALLEQTLPEGLSKEERARRIARRDKQIAKLYSDSKSDKAKATKNSNKEISEVGTKLRATITAARESYSSNKQALNESYEKIYQQEYDKILSEYKKPEKKKTKKKSN